MKYLRQIAWHILPTVIVFLTLLGIQFLPAAAFVVILALFSTSETGSVSTWEFVSAILVAVSNALVPSVGLFFIAPVLDRSVRNKPVWLKIVLPFPFILAVSLLVYTGLRIPVPEEGST